MTSFGFPWEELEKFAASRARGAAFPRPLLVLGCLLYVFFMVGERHHLAR